MSARLLCPSLPVSPKCVHNGTEFAEGEVYRMDSCWLCQCRGGISFCSKAECAKLECDNIYIPEGECCPVCTGTLRSHALILHTTCPHSSFHTLTAYTGHNNVQRWSHYLALVTSVWETLENYAFLFSQLKTKHIKFTQWNSVRHMLEVDAIVV